MMSSRSYWCYRCQRSVTIASRDNLLCPFCDESFLEEVSQQPRFSSEQAFPRRNSNHAELQSRSRSSPRNFLIPFPIQRSADFSQINQRVIAPFLDGMGLAAHHIHPHIRGIYPTDNMILWHSALGNGRDGGSWEVFLDDEVGFTARRLPRDFGDFFLGPGFDRLMRNLGENDANAYQGQPAAQSAVDAMPTVAITSEHLREDIAFCAVCTDQYEAGSEVRQMPCKHTYHEDCILPWLAHHNSCPVCRYKMPTEESIADLRGTSNSTSSNVSNGRASAVNRGYRRLRLLLARPFRFFRSSPSSSAGAVYNASTSAGSSHERQSPRDNR